MSSTEITIRILQRADHKSAQELDELMYHLNPKPHHPLSVERLEGIIASPYATIFVAEERGMIVGSLTLQHYITPLCDKFWIEDVVVAPEVRGRGVGRKLLRAALAKARQIAPQASIYLTSNPQRTAARELYRSEGFEQYETGVFRLP